MKLILYLFGHLSPGMVSKYFGRLQIVSSSFMAFGHGSNDAQKAMGIITMALLSGGVIETMDVPKWVVLICALAMGFGTLFGGWKIIKTLGHKMLKLEPIHGFAAETASTGIIIVASHWGLPVSTTHVVSTAILGVGATKRLPPFDGVSRERSFWPGCSLSPSALLWHTGSRCSSPLTISA